MKKAILFLALSVCSVSAVSQETLTRLLRQPDIHNDTVAFVYAGDIWLAPAAGGDARRLTSDAGMEYFPKFSPDGRWIAFTGDYSGNRQVFVISVDGGQPRQLTFYNDVGNLPPRGGIDNRILDWSPDGKNILFLPHRLPWGDRMGRPYIVPAAGGMETPLAIPEGGGGMYSPDGKQLVYTPIEREFRTWKRYRGGRAQDVWTYDLTANTTEQITNTPYTDNQPVWVGDTIYFSSDRPEGGQKEAGRLNLYAYDLKTKQTRKVTNHTDYDVLWPSADRTQVVYENGGSLYRYANGKSSLIPIRVYGDFRNTLPYFKNVRDNIDSYTLSPSGARALFVARGDIFSVPAKEGEIRNVTQTPGIRERGASWSPDGRWIAYLSDRSGDYEIYVRPADGTGDERKITSDGKSWRFDPLWSPDSKQLAFSDKDHALHVLDVASGKVTAADKDDYGDIVDYKWSPDSRWLTYTKNNEAQFSSVYVYNLGDAKAYRLTSGMTNDANPVFDPKGRYLYFTSNRDFNLTFSAWEFNYVYTDPTRVYVGVLSEDGPALFLPQSDEEKATAPPSPAAAAASEEKKPDAPKADAAKKSVVVKIDPATFERRVRAIPGAPGNYGNLSALPNGVMYIKTDGDAQSLRFYNVDDRKEETFLEDLRGYDLSASGEKILVSLGRNSYAIVNPKPAQKTAEAVLKLDTMQMKVDPKVEWAQEYTDAWRILRDWFYDPSMHGLDWNAIRAKYGQLVPHVAHRADLDYILGELAGELNAGHVYVGSPSDLNQPRVENGLLGAEIVADGGYFRIQHIFPGENWHESFRSPLTEPGVKVKEGDYILAVDGISTKGVDNFYRLLENKADRVVTLLVNSSANTTGAREQKVRPVKKETNLRYLDWVASRRAYVDKASGGRIGYMHLPNTGQEGNRELFKSFFPQVNKEALIIDDRYNGGGFIPDRMIELLDRPVLNYWARRNTKPTATPAYAHVGPKAMLTNGYSSSGGDALPYYFRKRGLGTVIGTRTWGGLIGISNNPSLMDGGNVSAPQFRFFDTEGLWAVEGVGVSPDIEVIDRADLVAKGQDPSLEAAVKLLLEELAKNPVKRPGVPDVSVER
ncbi:MAG TPA: PDZ domain-containing protein [Thermoanaerobaculia bacterium]|nr:PDZ domain-containing protein [Thermoanaerobaculia bacterium]